MIATIDSIKDPRIVLARALRTRKGRDTHGKILLEGEQIFDWAIERGVQVELVLTTETGVTARYSRQGIEVFVVSEGIQKKVTDTRYVIPVVGVGQLAPRSGEARACDTASSQLDR